jgi:hypothetical protein
MSLILNTHPWQARSRLRDGPWGQIVARFAAHRVGLRPQEVQPAIARLAPAASWAACEQRLEGRPVLQVCRAYR